MQCLQVGLSFLREQMEITDRLLSNRINILNIEVYGKRREKGKEIKLQAIHENKKTLTALL